MYHKRKAPLVCSTNWLYHLLKLSKLSYYYCLQLYRLIERRFHLVIIPVLYQLQVKYDNVGWHQSNVSIARQAAATMLYIDHVLYVGFGIYLLRTSAYILTQMNQAFYCIVTQWTSWLFQKLSRTATIQNIDYIQNGTTSRAKRSENLTNIMERKFLEINPHKYEGIWSSFRFVLLFLRCKLIFLLMMYSYY